MNLLMASCIFFSDASNSGYSVVIYVILVHANGQINCSLLMRHPKQRRLACRTLILSLNNATVSVSLNKVVIDTTGKCSIIINSVYFWTDSMTVIRYIHNRKTQFHTSVVYRFSLI